MKRKLDTILKEMEQVREEKQFSKERPDYIIRVCEAIVARAAGYKDRADWRNLQEIG